MKDDIKKVVRQCKECQIKQPSQAQQPIMQRNQATFPWQVVGSDLFQIDGDGRQNYYLVVVDQYSGFPLIAKFNKAPDTAAVINHLEHWFYIFGVPQQLISDQGHMHQLHFHNTQSNVDSNGSCQALITHNRMA